MIGTLKSPVAQYCNAAQLAVQIAAHRAWEVERRSREATAATGVQLRADRELAARRLGPQPLPVLVARRRP